MANSCPWKFVVFKIYRFSSKYASFKNINIDSQCFQFQFQGAAIRPIVPRQKHSHLNGVSLRMYYRVT